MSVSELWGENMRSISAISVCALSKLVKSQLIFVLWHNFHRWRLLHFIAKRYKVLILTYYLFLGFDNESNFSYLFQRILIIRKFYTAIVSWIDLSFLFYFNYSTVLSQKYLSFLLNFYKLIASLLIAKKLRGETSLTGNRNLMIALYYNINKSH